MLLCRAVAPVALSSVRDLQWYFPLAAEAGCISNLRWMQAVVCCLFSVSTAAESIVIECMLLCMSCCLSNILYSTYSKHSS